jgi:Copper type II ascorbate-dependent monooxygenase, C-terminal domain
LSTPLQFQPGDEIRVDCVYQSTNASDVTPSGPFRNQELCYGFIGYYPAIDSFTRCGQWKDVDVCSNDGIRCDYVTFNILAVSLNSGICASSQCSNACRVILEGIRDTGCLTGNIGQYVSTYAGVNIINYLIYLCNVSSTPSMPVNTQPNMPPATTTSTFSCSSIQQTGMTQSICNHNETCGCS